MRVSTSPDHPEQPYTPEDAILLDKIKWLVIFRIVLVTLLLGFALIIQFRISRASRPLDLLYLLIILSYLFTIITLQLLKWITNIRLYCYTQITFDLCFETGIIYITGGIESVFTFTYIFTIIGASILLFRRGALISASFSTIFYGLLVDLQYYNVLSPPGPTQTVIHPVTSSAVYYNIFLNACAFYLVAVLSSYLSESLRRTHQRLRETSHDLSELQTLHHNILDSMHSGLLTTDLHGKITSYNHAAELITGYQVSEVYGTDFQHIFQDITIPHIIQTLATLRKDAQRLETKITTKTGLPVHLGLSISSLRDDTGKIAGVICIFQDLTELKEMEDHIHRAERLAAIGQLAAGVAHEIRNPLASISGAIQMLQTELDLDEDNQALMQIIRRESKRLDAILTDFLLYARPQTITLAKCDIIHEVIVTVIGLLKQDEHCSQDTIQIQVNAPQNFPKIVCDAQQLKQVFWNIGLNALQAMPQGGTLTIDAALETVEPWELDTTGPIQAAVFAVSDTGPGIDADTQKNIFYPFYTTKPNGTGLGLAIAHQIIKNHHGSIRVKHSRPQGTTFEVVLPLTQEHW